MNFLQIIQILRMLAEHKDPIAEIVKIFRSLSPAQQQAVTKAVAAMTSSTPEEIEAVEAAIEQMVA
jgi:Tat protein secretion system quality control protein TatD with DNase activity